ncbi:unnamed protein product [Lepeophtheirus salmonis]|uniref:(salmon louse) hypothetical protein n=1 Tax=Lepeophtheirus salmonis TaxID=72036 RepID=A0A7R8CSB8_LEPSM|nr:unnamed protein product [Lepeophtheirus salmonis]CAF2915206.1 unnamed protein product [Lepeophtheirus salmonis]
MAHENSSEEIATALNSILNRLKSTRTNKVINALIQTNAVTKLVAYLDKFGSNVSSVSVGILEALLQFEQPRNQISKCNGIEKIVQLLDNTSEESTIYHICKTITNMESDSKLLTTLLGQKFSYYTLKEAIDFIIK